MIRTLDLTDIDHLVKEGIITPQQSFKRGIDIPIVHLNAGERVTGLLCLRPMFYAHSLVIPSHSRFLANQLIRFASDLGRHSGIHGCIFQIAQDNSSMRGYIEGLDAVAEPDSILYRLDRDSIEARIRR